MGLPLNFDTPPTVCGPANACMARPLYPHVVLLPTGEYFLAWTKCAPAARPSCVTGSLGFSQLPKTLKPHCWLQYAAC